MIQASKGKSHLTGQTESFIRLTSIMFVNIIVWKSQESTHKAGYAVSLGLVGTGVAVQNKDDRNQRYQKQSMEYSRAHV